jgi:hypothetical protein
VETGPVGIARISGLGARNLKKLKKNSLDKTAIK